MGEPQHDIQRRYLDRLRERLLEERGHRCAFCPDPLGPLQWAHLKPTGLDGRGRGSKHRLLDVQRHPDCYALLCAGCHGGLDAILMRF